MAELIKCRVQPLTEAWLAYLALLAILGLAGGWTSPLDYDEKKFYLPTIRFFAESFPRVPIENYPFAGPPAGFIIQSLVYKFISNDPGYLRILASLFSLVLAITLLLYFGKKSENEPTGVLLLAVVCFPFVLKNAFSLKHHNMTLAFVALALLLWEEAVDQRSKCKLFLSMLCLILAVSMNQMVIPLCLALLAASVQEFWEIQWRWDSFFGIQIMAAMIPLLALSSFFMLWKGVEPPAVKSVLDVSALSSLRIRPGQLILGLLCLGTWVVPIARLSRKQKILTGLLWLPCAAGIYVSGFYRPNAAFMESAAGPVSTVIRSFFHNAYPLIVLMTGLIVALGLSFLVADRDRSKGGQLFKTYSILYIAMMTFAVPSFFESYYVLLIVPGYLMIRQRLATDAAITSVFIRQMIVPIAGVCYMLFKIVGHLPHEIQ